MFPSPPAVASEIKQDQKDSKIQCLKSRHEQGSGSHSFPHYFAHPSTSSPTAHLFAWGGEGEPGRTLPPDSLWRGALAVLRA